MSVDYHLIATSAFGIESVTARELSDLGMRQIQTSNGRIDFVGDARDLIRANLWLRTADRVLICLAQFRAVTFEELFEGVFAIDWADILPENARIHVVGKSVKSGLFSVPDCQSITKKAIVEKLKKRYHRQFFEEDGAEYRISVSILKDEVSITLDTSGAGLHKRGYRSLAGEAPLKETLACAMLLLSFWKPGRLLIDPMCGSGTIPIEAAMISLNRAPGLRRKFCCEEWEFLPSAVFDEERQRAQEMMRKEADLCIFGSDINPKAVELAQLHAQEAGVEDFVRFKQQNVKDLYSKQEYGFIITNPPYGERLGESRDAERLYTELGHVFSRLNTWSLYLITSNPYFEKQFGRKADKRRKLYNGRLECQYYQYLGPKPPRVAREK